MSECDCPNIDRSEIINGNVHKYCGGVIDQKRLNEPIKKSPKRKSK